LRLCAANLGAFPASVARPRYQRDTRGVGIVHFGIGAFHRAHMAAYTDDAMAAGEGDWRILGVSLRSPAVRDQMRPQDGLYTLVERSASGAEARIIGSVADVLVASDERERLVATLAAATTHIASFTITEKGYCRAPDGSLDLALADERSAYAYLAESFAIRRDAGLPGLSLLSCDNLAGNGAQLKRLMIAYLDAHAPDLTDWFEQQCTCPSTMVDRIVPATTDADRQEIEALLGMRDEAAVVTEPFNQWVIEDKFAGPRPVWEQHGAQITSDVHAYENAKLRMLNGAHSALAYLGLQRGHEFVHQAIGDPELLPIIDTLMRNEAATSLIPAPGQDLSAYADALIERFKNPALNHRLIQIAMDGSQKVPQRWLETLAFHQKHNRQCPAILAGIAAWIRHVRGDNGPVDDPLAATLKTTWDAAGKHDVVSALFALGGPMASDWVPSDADRELIITALNRGVGYA
jgi:fructuronate reductase